MKTLQRAIKEATDFLNKKASSFPTDKADLKEIEEMLDREVDKDGITDSLKAYVLVMPLDHSDLEKALLPIFKSCQGQIKQAVIKHLETLAAAIKQDLQGFLDQGMDPQVPKELDHLLTRIK